MRTRPRTIIVATLALLVSCAAAASAQHPVAPGPGIWQSRSSSLEIGEMAGGQHGSLIAQRILREVLASGDIVVLEDHSDSPTVNFGQIEQTLYINDATHRPQHNLFSAFTVLAPSTSTAFVRQRPQ